MTMVESSWSTDGDPGGGGMPFRPGDPDQHRKLYQEEEATWCVIQDKAVGSGKDKIPGTFSKIKSREAFVLIKNLSNNGFKIDDITRMRQGAFLVKVPRKTDKDLLDVKQI